METEIRAGAEPNRRCFVVLDATPWCRLDS